MNPTGEETYIFKKTHQFFLINSKWWDKLKLVSILCSILKCFNFNLKSVLKRTHFPPLINPALTFHYYHAGLSGATFKVKTYKLCPYFSKFRWFRYLKMLSKSSSQVLCWKNVYVSFLRAFFYFIKVSTFFICFYLDHWGALNISSCWITIQCLSWG